MLHTPSVPARPYWPRPSSRQIVAAAWRDAINAALEELTCTNARVAKRCRDMLREKAASVRQATLYTLYFTLASVRQATQ